MTKIILEGEDNCTRYVVERGIQLLPGEMARYCLFNDNETYLPPNTITNFRFIPFNMVRMGYIPFDKAKNVRLDFQPSNRWSSASSPSLPESSGIVVVTLYSDIPRPAMDIKPALDWHFGQFKHPEEDRLLEKWVYGITEAKPSMVVDNLSGVYLYNSHVKNH